VTLKLTTSLSSTITKSELESNFTSIQSKFAGAIDNSDIKTGAGIDVTKLSAYKEYVTVNLANMAFDWGSASDGTVIAMAALPGLSGGQANWTLVEANWFFSDGGSSGNPTVDVDLMYYDGSGDLQSRTSLIAEAAMTRIADNKGNSGEVSSFASTAVSYDGSEPRLLVLRRAGVAGADMGSAIQVGVTLLLERNIQA